MTKIIKYCFVYIVIGILVITGIMTNTKENFKSTIDNRMLTEFPEIVDSNWTKNVEVYLADRVGFRDNYITNYQIVSDKVFGMFARKGYKYGKEKQIFLIEDEVTYQHRDVKEEYINLVADYFGSIRKICDQIGAKLYYFCAPNKGSILGEYYPEGYNIADQPNQTDLVYSALNLLGITTIDVRETWNKLTDKARLFNKKYDPAHWNANGHFESMVEINDALCQDYPNLGKLDIDLFSVGEKIEPYYNESYFPINESTPTYTLKEDNSVEENSVFDIIPHVNYAYHWENPKNNNGLKILFIGDSYLGTGFGTEICFKTRCQEFTRIHIKNIADIPLYISYFKPDMVVYEAVERVLGEKSFWSPDKLDSGLIYGDKNLELTQQSYVITEEYVTGDQNPKTVIKGTVDTTIGNIDGLFCSTNDNNIYAKYDRASGDFTFILPFDLNNGKIQYYASLR